MVYDRNPRFGADQSFSENARRVADFLWETTGGNLSEFPLSYLENLRHEFVDGKVSMMELIDRVDLGPEATYDDYVEMVDMLLAVEPDRFANPPEEIVEIQPTQLLYEFEPDLDFSEFDFAEEVEVEEEVTVDQDPLSDKMELFLKKVIASVYQDGVTSVTDIQGNPPNAANNYLLADDGKSFSGIFYDSPPNEEAKKFPFKIVEKGPDQWQIKY